MTSIRHGAGDVTRKVRTAMWDTVQEQATHLSHDLPCPECGHAAHSYLPCSDSCACARGRVLIPA